MLCIKMAAIKVIKGQISDVALYHKKYVLRSSVYVESLIGLWKSAQYFCCAAVLKLSCAHYQP